MNGRVAKRLRKSAYGDTSQRINREYEWQTRVGHKQCGIVNAVNSPRAIYQRLKVIHRARKA